MIHQLARATFVLVISVATLLVTGCIVSEAPYQPPPPPVVAPPPAAAPVVVEQPGPPPGTEIVVVGTPPPVYQESITVSPGVGFVWISRQYWQNQGGRYAGRH